MTSSLIFSLILSVGIVPVIVGMLVWAIEADRRAQVGSKSRAAASCPAVAPGITLSRRSLVSGSSTAGASVEA
jgi:hypothetical protein